MESEHTIGDGSSYDADMSLIESFVRSFNRGDEISQLSVFSYYYSQLLNYWSFFKESLQKDINDASSESNYKYNELTPFLTYSYKEIGKEIEQERRDERYEMYGDSYNTFLRGFKRSPRKYIEYGYSREDIEQSLFPLPDENGESSIHEDALYDNRLNIKNLTPLSNSFIAKTHTVLRGKEMEFILKNIQMYENRFLELLEIIKKNFEAAGELIISEITYVFMYVCTLICYETRVEYVLPVSYHSMLDDTSYLLPNNTGSFGFNTYLYAFFNGISLIGVPNKIADFDGRKGCPVIFMDHDYRHSMTIRSSINNVKSLRKIYYKILNSNYTKKLKELLILVIWILIHEHGLGNVLDSLINETNKAQHNNKNYNAEQHFTQFYRVNIHRLYEDYVRVMSDEFSSFDGIINTEEAVSLITSVFPETINIISDENYLHIMVILYGISFIVTQISLD